MHPLTLSSCHSISVIQWLCHAYKRHHNPQKRLLNFFTCLYGALRRGARAVFQFYPESAQQIAMLTEAAMRAGFTGGVVVDYPNSTKAKKYFLTLFTATAAALPQAKGGGVAEGVAGDAPCPTRVTYGERHAHGGTGSAQRHARSHAKRTAKDRDWVLRKKATQRKRGIANIPTDTKYTARKRKPRF